MSTDIVENEWFSIINYYCRIKKPIGYGLTIPFLVGTISGFTIKRLLTEITSCKCRESIILRYCYDINEYVLSLDDLSYPYAKKIDTRINNLIIYDEENELSNNLEELIAYFENRYFEILTQNKFSKGIDNNWYEFSEKDDWRLNFKN